MNKRQKTISQFFRNERALVAAYACVMAASAGIAMMINVARTQAAADLAFYGNWTIFAGAAAAGVALFVLRKWFGRAGVMGLMQATVGTLLLALLTAMIAGLLIAPVAGVVMAPIMLGVTFLWQPWVAVVWFGVAIAAHFLLGIWAQDQAAKRYRALSQLSRLSQINLYGRSFDH